MKDKDAFDKSAFTNAWVQTERIVANEPDRRNDPTLPIYQEDARHRLEVERGRFEAGDRMALLGAIRICANHDLPLPGWASRAFIAGYDQVLNCQAASWDTVFGRPYPGKHLRNLKQRRDLLFAVLNEVRRRLSSDPKPPIDVALFQSVGKQFSIGATLCGELYYSAVDMTSAKL